MTLRRGIWVDRDGSSLGVLPLDARLAMVGLLADGGGANLSFRSGVFYDGSGAVVTGTTATGTMTYSIRACAMAIPLLGTVASGAVVLTNDGAVTVNTTNAPGANSRIDVIWVRQQAVASDGGADVINTAIFGVTQGTAAASPSVPAIPTGAYALATVVVPTGTTQTSALAFTQVHTWTNASGAPIAIRDLTDRGTLVPYDGLEIYRLDLRASERYDGVLGGFRREQARFPTDGLVNRPRRLLTRTTTFSLGDSANAAVGGWTTETGDDGNSTGISLSTNILTVANAGLYEIEFTMEFTASATGLRRLILLKNGAVGPPATGTVLSQTSSPGSAAGLNTVYVRWKGVLAAADTVIAAVFQNSGGALTVGSTTAGIVFWRAELMGP